MTGDGCGYCIYNQSRGNMAFIAGLERERLVNKLSDAIHEKSAGSSLKADDVIPLLEGLDLGLTSVEMRSTVVEALGAFEFPVSPSDFDDFTEVQREHQASVYILVLRRSH